MYWTVGASVIPVGLLNRKHRGEAIQKGQASKNNEC